jgi:hypothetical protein
MAQHDFNIANATFPSVRSDINSVLEAINTSNSGTSRPSSAVAGTVWLDTTSATTPTLKFYDGADDISLATFDYSANTVNWLDSTVVFDIVGDTTPQLGGDLDVNGNSLVSTSDGDITFTPDGTGKVVISGLNFPTADGTADQVLKTDGSGNLSFTDVSGGTSWQSSIVTASTLAAAAGNGYWINTTSNACTITLPASASVGDTIEFVDYARTWGTNSITINQNSLNFQGNTSPNPVYDVDGQSVRIVYSGATQGWIPTVDDDVTLETPQAYDIDYLVVGGGGAGGSDSNGGNNSAGGGGGAGGLRSGTYSSVALGVTITAVVGAGGSGSATANGASGSASSIAGAGLTTISSAGGGGGGSEASNGLDGGSGGGGGLGNDGPTGSGGSGNTPSVSPSQGSNGGSGQSPNSPTASGGGGGGAGEAGNTDGQGFGGDGTQSSITGSATYYAGGGGGGVNGSGSTIPSSDGGGGAGTLSGAGDPATDGLGGGGGGAGGASPNIQAGGAGGDGVVILSVPTANYSTTTTGSPTVTTSGANTIIKFTGNGTYTS